MKIKNTNFNSNAFGLNKGSKNIFNIINQILRRKLINDIQLQR